MRKLNRRAAVTAYVAVVGGLDGGLARDARTRLGELSKRGGANRRSGSDRRAAPPAAAGAETITLREVAKNDEPTWEIRRPVAGRFRNRRIDRRTRWILTVAVVAAVVVNAGAAWAYWKVSRSEPATVRAGYGAELTLRGRSHLSLPLTPGGTGNLTVTVTNDNDFPIRITSVTAGVGNIIADDEHRDAGCRVSRVSMTKDEFAVSWSVARNTLGAFTLPNGIRMAANTDTACGGATFTVPVRMTAVSGPS
jgi:hypothetical protein